MKYKFFIFSNETKHHTPHIHIRLSDGRQGVVSLNDFSLIIGNLKTKELKQIKKDLEKKQNELLKIFYLKNPDKK